MAPAPLAVERSRTTDLYPCPPSGRERWHHNSYTHLHTHTRTNIVAHIHFHPPAPPNELQPMVYFPAVHSHSTLPPLSLSLMFFFFPLSPPSWRLPGSRERLHTHIHTTMPLRVFRMSLFTSWSVQVVGKQTQSLPGYVCISPILTSIHLVSMQMFMAALRLAFHC